MMANHIFEHLYFYLDVIFPGNERFMNELCERELNELNAKILRDPQ